MISFKEYILQEDWLDNIQSGLSFIGLAPAIGIPVDLANAGISALRGKGKDALLNLGAAVPILGYGANTVKAARGAKKIGALTKAQGKQTMSKGQRRAEGLLQTGKELGLDTTTGGTSHMDKSTNDAINAIKQYINKSAPGTPPAAKEPFFQKAIDLFTSGKLNKPLLITIALGAIGAGALMTSHDDDSEDEEE